VVVFTYHLLEGVLGLQLPLRQVLTRKRIRPLLKNAEKTGKLAQDAEIFYREILPGESGLPNLGRGKQANQ
jgi:hypothetical protein